MIDRTPCPFVKAPFDECYISSMTSGSIGEAVYYCGGNFRECDIYKKHIQLNEEKNGSARTGVSQNKKRKEEHFMRISRDP